jgi:putative ABC transport system permease protein
MNATTVRLALRELWANKMRTFLTCLGMIIGIGAVIALVTVGNGVTAQITSTLESLGNNLIFAFPGGPGCGGRGDNSPFDQDDVEAIRRGVPGVGGYKAATQAEGGEASYFRIGLWKIAEGRFFGESEAGRSVCVIGKTVRDKLFAGGTAVGQRIRLGRVPCDVIGVLKAKGTSMFTGDQDDLIVMPLKAFQRRIQGNSDLFNIQISAASRADIPRVMDGVRQALRSSRGIGAEERDNFTVRDLQGFVEQAQSIFGYVTLFVSAVAAISLVVGGIGIMNIMLVSVTERTREIGVRLAIGALEHEVLLQFLIEAVVLSSFGGLVGIALATAASIGLSSLLAMPYAFQPGINGLAFVFSAAIGVVFGYVPARRAARLDPIEALRHE